MPCQRSHYWGRGEGGGLNDGLEWAFWMALNSVSCHGTDPVFIYSINVYREDLLNAREYGETWRTFRHDSIMNFA